MTEEEITPEEFARIQEEEFGVSPEERARINAKLSATLADLRSGRLPLHDLPDVIHEFGEERFDEALPEIVASLTSPNERVRYMALHVLTFHFQLKDYKPAAIEMLLHDPDEDCRRQAAAGLGSLMKNTEDRESLHALAQVVHNEEETEAVCASAYKSMYSIVHYDRQQQKQLTETLFEPGFTFDWEFVDTYL
jgi:HEAT repeat protein